MPVVELPKEKWMGKVREVTLGATAANGGTRTKTVTVGGETTLPFLHFEGIIPHRPVIAVEVVDAYPEDWSPTLLAAWGDTAKDVVAWAKKAEEMGADLIALKLRSTHPDSGNRSPAEAAATVKQVLGAVGLPLLVYGPGLADKDNDVLVAVAEAAVGERLALGLCEDKNYRTIVAGAMAHGHLVMARTPIDVNLAKQLNILISDMGLPLERILMDPTTGALGYGLEYTYSVMERLRIAALMGDSMTQQPLIVTVGEESWRQKESKVPQGVPAAWGDFTRRGIIWETTTATALLESGADVVILRHPQSIKLVQGAIDKLMAA
ncbi:MAG: acetyl-CoA decarbonylase/synthase complex subunit delta [Chloroflexi bacterium]|nr:acetyl-CoA decarbonylase/synthase complex subunit delta [Chloroflexota bacterium]